MRSGVLKLIAIIYYTCIIFITLIVTITKKAISKGKMLISKEQARYLFHDFETERISFKHNNMMSSTTPRTASWGAPMIDAAEIIPVVLLTIVLESIYLLNLDLVKPYVI
jgi:hypothetical protein